MEIKKIVSQPLPPYEPPQLIQLTTQQTLGNGAGTDCVAGSAADNGACLSGYAPYLACIVGNIT